MSDTQMIHCEDCGDPVHRADTYETLRKNINYCRRCQLRQSIAGGPTRKGDWQVYAMVGINASGEPFGPVKIGRSRDPQRRLQDCQTGSPVKLELVAIERRNLEFERQLHSQFQDRRAHGEWFDVPLADVVEAIRNG